ncbi:MAG: pyridoxal-phosphate dependent enzyme [Anaerolineae bacterium]|nr:pyridoxal-phosphate dependent enzyme [Anaerolineae bacterium]
MTSLFNKVRCLECAEALEVELFPGNCPKCGSSWIEAGYAIDGLPKDWPEIVASRQTNLWRYQELLPFPDDFKVVGMGEGWTPLTRAEGLEQELGLTELWIKDERQQPTGSFKDRQAASAVSALKAQGVKELVLASTGNAAAAYAAFCARAGIKLWVFLTSSVPAEKMRELALYGAEVIKITGTYDQAKDVAADFAQRRGLYFDKGAKAIPNKESMKTVAFEIVEQLGWRAPDWYIQAVSGGLGPLGVLKGFRELFEAGIIDKVPKIGVVQVDGCAPMVRAWEAGLDTAEAVVPDTLITVLSTGNPGFAYNILKQAADEHGGAMVSVSDGDAFRAMRRLARSEGFSVEPATSVAFAGLEKLIEKGHLKSDDVIVVNCSGHTFSAEKHALEDRYVVDLEIPLPEDGRRTLGGIEAALAELDEQVTSIVIIDDNEHHRRLIRRLLNRHKKYRVFEADNGPDGVDLVKQRKPELVVLDLTIPEMDGFSILETFKQDERTRDIPVMIVSGKDLTKEQQEFLDGKASTILQKGRFSGKELVSQVVEMLGDEGLATSDLELNAAPKFPDSIEEELPEFTNGDRPKVLVVDDNIWDARLLRRLLEIKKQYEVTEVYSGKEALASISEQTPDLIILDLLLPDVNGNELIKQIRAQDKVKDVPVLIISSKEIEPGEMDELSEDADSIWSKASADRNNLIIHVDKILAE